MRSKKYLVILILLFLVGCGHRVSNTERAQSLSNEITTNIEKTEEILEDYFSVWKNSVKNSEKTSSYEIGEHIDRDDEFLESYLAKDRHSNSPMKATLNVHSLNAYFSEKGILNKLNQNFERIEKEYDKLGSIDEEAYGNLMDEFNYLKKLNLFATNPSIALEAFINETVNNSLDSLGDLSLYFENLRNPLTSKSSRVDEITSIVRYVTLDGSDDNLGTADSPYATLQKALDDEPDKIYIEPGIYYNQSAQKGDIKNLTIQPMTHDIKSRDTVEFRGSDVLKDWEPYSSIYRTEYSGNQYFEDTFISKTKPVETSGSRTTYNAILWEGNDGDIDYKMKPVLTLSEVKQEVGTFYYDGSHVYINPEEISNEFNAIKTSSGINLAGENITLIDIKTTFYFGTPFNLDGIDNLYAKRLTASHSGSSDGFSLDLTDGVLIDSKAYKNRNDGFNMYYSGNTIFINCYGMNNYDDGISHHGYTKGLIVGGAWTGNAKGGISPVNDAMVSIYKSYIAENNFALWNVGNPDGLTVSRESIYRENLNGYNNGEGLLLSIHDILIENGESLGKEAEYYLNEESYF